MTSFPVSGDERGPAQNVQVSAHPSGAHLHSLGEHEGGCGPVQLSQDLRLALADQRGQRVTVLTRCGRSDSQPSPAGAVKPES
jgi:hypothetical protein